MNILRSFTETVVTTPTELFPISFEYDEKYDAVHVFLNDVAVEDLGYTVSQVNAVTLKVEPAIPEGTVRIERETDIDKMKYIFDAGALFIDQNVDADFKQIVHAQQEVRDGFIKLRGDVLPLVHGLQEALQQAQEASQAAQEAAEAAEEAAQQTRMAEKVIDSSTLTQQDLNDASIYVVGSVAAMLALTGPLQNRVVKVLATQAMYKYNAANAGVNNGLSILNGWELLGYKDRVLLTLAGVKGDGTDEFTAINKAFVDSARLGIPLDLCGLNTVTSPLTLTGAIRVIGNGSIKLAPNSNTFLLKSAYDLIIEGKVTLDPDLANNSGGTITGESHCTINHTGPNLILKGTTIKPSRSNNLVLRSTKSVVIKDADIQGGMINVFGIVPNAKVMLINSKFNASTLYDNVAFYNAEDVAIIGCTSTNSTRSGFAINNTSKKSRFIGNLCSGNKRDASNQGGWGIVTSINAQDSLVVGNNLIGNQVGGITLDTFTPVGTPSVDNRLVVAGNTINGLYNGTYSTTGISLNDAWHATVVGNNIYKVAQGIHTDTAYYATIVGNTIQDVSGYFIQLFRADYSLVACNNCDGTVQTANGSFNIIDTKVFSAIGNKLFNLTGQGNAFRVSGASFNWLIADNHIYRSVAGSSYVFHILGTGATDGTGNIGGVIRNNTIMGEVSGAWQYVYVSNNAAQFTALNNFIQAAGVGYTYQCNPCTFGDDTYNGDINWYNSIPTFKVRRGQQAIIAGVRQWYDGTTWKTT